MKLGDKVVAAIILLLIIISTSIVLFIMNTNFDNKSEKKVIIKVDGITKKVFSIDDTMEGIYGFTFHENKGQVEVNNGAVRMVEMTRDICPRKICSDTGWISKDYEMIVCLPNKLSVEIQSDSTHNDEELDFIIR